jgi:hypothetical protein
VIYNGRRCRRSWEPHAIPHPRSLFLTGNAPITGAPAPRVVPMDSADCCHNATTCIDMANHATERREQSVLFELARSWLMLGWEMYVS